MFTFGNRRSREFEDSRFLKAEQNAIDKSKYIESKNANRDLFFDGSGRPSQDFYVWWIDSHAENFRKAWITSACRKCRNVDVCKNCLRELCRDFLYDPEWEVRGALSKTAKKEKE